MLPLGLFSEDTYAFLVRHGLPDSLARPTFRDEVVLDLIPQIFGGNIGAELFPPLEPPSAMGDRIMTALLKYRARLIPQVSAKLVELGRHPLSY